MQGGRTIRRVLLASINYRPALLSKFTSSTFHIRSMSTPPPPSFDNVNAARMTGILTHSEDKYDGVIISSDDLPNSLDEFMSTLNASIAYWRSTKRRGVWLKVPIEKSEYIAPAVAAGFVFHHAGEFYSKTFDCQDGAEMPNIRFLKICIQRRRRCKKQREV
jgi:hypothetical protein